MYTGIKNYEDVTENWIKTATPNSHSVLDGSFVFKNGIKYYVDGKKVVLDYNTYEKETALWLEKTLGGELFMLPRVNSPEGIRTSDYLFRGEYWDLKVSKSKTKMAIDYVIKKSHGQSNNFIIDITFSPLDEIEIFKQIEILYVSPRREWVDIVLIKKDNQLIKIFQRKRN